jgi:hypothetical protein
LYAAPRLTVPPGRTRNRLAALFLVFILGIAAPSSILPSAGDRMIHAVLGGL